MQYDAHAIIETSIGCLLNVQNEVMDSVWRDRVRCFEPVVLETQDKPAAVVDVVAEWLAAALLSGRLKKLKPLVIGEESLRHPAPGLDVHSGIVVLVDALDGTRLLKCGLDDWCSALTVLVPATRTILCSVVVFPTGTGYFASAAGAGKFRMKEGRLEYAAVSTCPMARSVDDATIAFYGYRLQRFASIGDLLTRRRARGEVRSANSNVFVVGGNPALVRTIEGPEAIDAVIEPFGQAAHDMLPGAYICRQAGGTVVDLQGAPLDLEGMLAAGPEARFAFVAARDRHLAASLVQDLNPLANAADAAGGHAPVERRH